MTAQEFAARLSERIAEATSNSPQWQKRELYAADLVAIARETMLLIRSVCPHTDLLRAEYYGAFFCRICQQALKDEDLLTAFAAQNGSGRPVKAATGPADSEEEGEYGDVSEETRAMLQAEHQQHFRN